MNTSSFLYDHCYSKNKSAFTEAAIRLKSKGKPSWYTGDMKGDPLASPDYADVAAVLDSIEIPVNTSRINVKIDEEQVVTGMCLGIVNGRGNGIIIGQETHWRKKLCKTLCNFANRYLPEDFEYTSIQVFWKKKKYKSYNDY